MLPTRADMSAVVATAGRPCNALARPPHARPRTRRGRRIKGRRQGHAGALPRRKGAKCLSTGGRARWCGGSAGRCRRRSGRATSPGIARLGGRRRGGDDGAVSGRHPRAQRPHRQWRLHLEHRASARAICSSMLEALSVRLQLWARGCFGAGAVLARSQCPV